MPFEDVLHDVVDFSVVPTAPSPKSVTNTLSNSTTSTFNASQRLPIVRKRLRAKHHLLSDHLSMTPSPPILSPPNLALNKKRNVKSEFGNDANHDETNTTIATPAAAAVAAAAASASSPAERPPKLKKRRNWAPIAVVPMKHIKLPTDLERDALTDIKLKYLSMCSMEQQIFHVSTLLSVIKCVLRGHADLKKIAALGRRLSKTRKRFLNVQRAVFDVQNERNPAPPSQQPVDSNAVSSRPSQISNPSDTDTSIHNNMPLRQKVNGNRHVADPVASQFNANANTPDDNSLSHLSFGALDKSPQDMLPQSSTPSAPVHPPSPLDVVAQQNSIPAALPQPQFELDNTSPIDTREIAAAYSRHPSRASIDQQWLSPADGLDVRQDVPKLASSSVEIEPQFGPQPPPPSTDIKLESNYAEQYEQSAPKLAPVNPYEQQPPPNIPPQYTPNHQFSPVTPVGSHRSVMGTAQEAFTQNNGLSWEQSYGPSVTNGMNNRTMHQPTGHPHYNHMVMQQQQQQQQQLVTSANLQYNPATSRLPAHLTNQTGGLPNSVPPPVPPHHPSQVRNVEMPNSFHPVQYGPMNNNAFHAVAPPHPHVEDVYDPQRMLGRMATNNTHPTPPSLGQPYGYPVEAHGNDFISAAEQQPRPNMQAPIFDSNRAPTSAPLMPSNFGFAGGNGSAADGGNQYISDRDVGGSGGGGGIIAEMHAAAASANAGDTTSHQPPQFHNVSNVDGSVNTIFASDTAATAAAASMMRPTERESFGSNNNNNMSYLGAWGQAS